MAAGTVYGQAEEHLRGRRDHLFELNFPGAQFFRSTRGNSRSVVPWTGYQESAARERFDLLSAIAHELGHHAGWNHDDTGFMSDRLKPGERRLPQPGDSDDQFAAFSGLDELLGF